MDLDLKQIRFGRIVGSSSLEIIVGSSKWLKVWVFMDSASTTWLEGVCDCVSLGSQVKGGSVSAD